MFQSTHRSVNSLLKYFWGFNSANMKISVKLASNRVIISKKVAIDRPLFCQEVCFVFVLLTKILVKLGSDKIILSGKVGFAYYLFCQEVCFVFGFLTKISVKLGSSETWIRQNNLISTSWLYLLSVLPRGLFCFWISYQNGNDGAVRFGIDPLDRCLLLEVFMEERKFSD